MQNIIKFQFGLGAYLLKTRNCNQVAINFSCFNDRGPKPSSCGESQSDSLRSSPSN